MTRDEIEALVEEALERRLGGIVAQIGKDLADRYATKEDVDRKIEARARQEADAVNRMWLDAAEAMRRDEKLSDDHPAAFVMSVLDDVLDLQLRVSTIGLWIVAHQRSKHPKREKTEDMQETFARVVKLSRIKGVAADLEHTQLLDWMEKAQHVGPEGAEMLRQMIEILGPKPELDDD